MNNLLVKSKFWLFFLNFGDRRQIGTFSFENLPKFDINFIEERLIFLKERAGIISALPKSLLSIIVKRSASAYDVACKGIIKYIPCFADAFAEAFCLGVNFLDFFFGFGVSQTGLSFFIPKVLLLSKRHVHSTLHGVSYLAQVPRDAHRCQPAPV